MPLRPRLVTSLVMMAALASCATPMAGLNPAGGSAAGTSTAGYAATLPASMGTPAPASVKPAPAPALPATPPMAEDARARLTGTVLINDTPVANASLVAMDLATEEPIALISWSDSPKALRLFSTVRTDAQGAFDVELPKLADEQIVKLIASNGTQTFTLLFDSNGQAIGGDAPTSASYQLQQGRATGVRFRVGLTPATTAATQAFQGVLKLSFQLPDSVRNIRRSAALEAARKAADEVRQALAKQPSIASRLVAAVNSQGETSQVENFRTAITNLGVFPRLFQAVQAELIGVATQALEVRKVLAAIRGSDFPLDQVVITASGLLGFSGQFNPIKLAGQFLKNFIPTPARGGGSNSAPASTPSVSPSYEWVNLFTTPTEPYGLAYLRNRVASASLAYSDDTATVTLLSLNDATASIAGTVRTPIINVRSVSQARNASPTLYFGSVNTGLGYYEPDPVATGVFDTGSEVSFEALAADSTRVYGVDLGNGINRPVRWWSHDRASSGVLQVDGQPWELPLNRAMAVFDPRVDPDPAATSNASSTIFVCSGSSIYAAQDGGASHAVATALGQIQGMAVATPFLYAADPMFGWVYKVNVNTGATSIFISNSTASGTVQVTGNFEPYGLALDDEANYLYVSDQAFIASGQAGRILRVKLR